MQNNIFLRIENLNQKLIICKSERMSFSADKTYELWNSFMTGRKKIQNPVSDELFSIQVYGADFDFSSFRPDIMFLKMAGTEVKDFDSVPESMEKFFIPAGLYAVFIHRGAASEAPVTFGYIFGEWLPLSGYRVDSRPHFEILGKKYRNNDPSSEEEVWVPVKPK